MPSSMRLLHTHLRQLEPPTTRPRRYAILSHTWGGDETTLQEWQGHEPASGPAPGGRKKVRMACGLAKDHGYEYIWIDTCCIDKTNSTELSQAINSMFHWYAEAEVCYAYLSDVPGDDAIRHPRSRFRESRWFKRGWTLQELLAPKKVHFYSQDWKYLGSKEELLDLISSITLISREALTQGECQPTSRSLGEILSWASRRTTTMEEDMAYALLGLLDVNMPLIYGEGPKAFIRLQEELLRRYDDESIFAWEAPPKRSKTETILWTGLAICCLLSILTSLPPAPDLDEA